MMMMINLNVRWGFSCIQQADQARAHNMDLWQRRMDRWRENDTRRRWTSSVIRNVVPGIQRKHGEVNFSSHIYWPWPWIHSWISPGDGKGAIPSMQVHCCTLYITHRRKTVFFTGFPSVYVFRMTVWTSAQGLEFTVLTALLGVEGTWRGSTFASSWLGTGPYKFPGSVSYTHLDVYKRQLQSCCNKEYFAYVI